MTVQPDPAENLYEFPAGCGQCSWLVWSTRQKCSVVVWAGVRPGRQHGSVPGRLSGAADSLRGMANFALTLIHGPGWDAGRPIREQDGWDGHAAFMDALVDDGFIIVGGPLGDGQRTLHVVEAADEPEIRARLAKDPWATAGLLEVGSIEPWALWLDGRG